MASTKEIKKLKKLLIKRASLQAQRDQIDSLESRLGYTNQFRISKMMELITKLAIVKEKIRQMEAIENYNRRH